MSGDVVMRRDISAHGFQAFTAACMLQLVSDEPGPQSASRFEVAGIGFCCWTTLYHHHSPVDISNLKRPAAMLK